MTTPSTANLWHGYSLADIHQLATKVIAVDRWRKDGDIRDRRDTAAHAITERLLTADRAPTRNELIDVGIRAANRHVADEMHHHGYDPRNLAVGAAGLPGFQRYWQAAGRSPFDERVVERIALAQIWPRLTEAQQQAVMALALTDDHQAAADTLGLKLGAFSSRVAKARRRAQALWHEHETPARLPMDKRVFNYAPVDGRGKRRLAEDDLDGIRQRRHAGGPGSTLRELAAEYGYTAAALCNLLNGKRRAAKAA